MLLALRSNSRGARALLALATITVGAPLLLALLGIEDRFYARNVILVTPLAATLAAPLMLRLRAVPLAAYLALALLTSVWVATNWRYEQVDWRDALARAWQRIRNLGATRFAGTNWATPIVPSQASRTVSKWTSESFSRAWRVGP